MTKKIIQTPHDKFFRASMSEPRIAKEFFENHLPAHIKVLLNLDTLHLRNGTFVDKELSLQLSDALFSVKRQDKDAYLYCLVEHQSTPDSLMPFRTVKYTLEIMEQHYKEHKNLPIVYVFVLYHGDKKYPYSTDVFDLFGEDKDLAQEILFKPFDLLDLTQIPDEQLKRTAWAGMLELTLKHAARQDLALFVKNVVQQIKTIEQAHGTDYLTTLFNYIFSVGEVENQASLIQVLHTHLSPELERNAMTFAEQLKQEGLQMGVEKGRQEGREEAMQEFALRLFQKNMSNEDIMAMTDLSLESVQHLRAQAKRSVN